MKWVVFFAGAWRVWFCGSWIREEIGGGGARAFERMMRVEVIKERWSECIFLLLVLVSGKPSQEQGTRGF